MQINTYVLFKGQCEEAFNHYAKVLNGKIAFLMTHKDSPMAEQTPAEWRGKVMHARLEANGQVIMGSDPPPNYYTKPEGFSVSLSVTDPKEAERIFNALSEGGTVKMPLQKTFWAKAFGMFIDRYGVPWMINCEES